MTRRPVSWTSPAGYNDRVDGAGARSAARRRVVLAAASGTAVLAVLGYAAFEFAGQATGNPAAAAGKQPAATPTPAASRTVAASATTATSTTPIPVATPTATATPASVRISPVSAVAFGPDGTADGDNPQNAARVLSDPAAGWLTQWYATPNFGELKTGTGLLLDMGRTVTITTVRLTLGGPPGASLQLRAGSVPALSALPVVTAATNAGDLLTMSPATPAKARYVLLWFTRLPPDGAGTYQIFVHQVTVRGRP